MDASNNLTEEVKRLNRRWMESYVSRDTAFLEQYLADDYVSTFPDGMVIDKQGEIESLKSGDIALTEMTPSEMNTDENRFWVVHPVGEAEPMPGFLSYPCESVSICGSTAAFRMKAGWTRPP